MKRKPKARKETLKSFVDTMLILPRKEKLKTRTCSLCSQLYSEITNSYFLIYPHSPTAASLFISPQAWETQCPHLAWVSLHCLGLTCLELDSINTLFSAAKASSITEVNKRSHYIYLIQTSLKLCVVLKAERNRCLQWLLEGQILWLWDLGIFVLIHEPELQCNLLKV